MSQAAMKQAQMHLPPMKGKGVPPPSSSAGSNSPLRSHAPTALQLNPHKKVQLNHAKMLLASPLSDWLHISKSMESKKEYFDAHNAPLPLLSNGSQQSDSNSVGSSSKTELAVSRDEFDDPRSTHNHKHHHKQTGKDNKPSTAANSSVNNAVADNKNGNSGERHRRFSFEAEDIQRLSAKYAHNQAVKGQPNGTPNPTLLSSLELFVDKDNGHVINDSNNKALQHAKKSLDILQDHISMIQQFSPTSRGGGVGPGYLMPPSSISSVASKSTLITPSHIDFTFTPTAQNANMDPDRVIPRINSFIGTNNDGGEEELIRKSLRSPKGPSQSNLLNSGNTGNLPLPLKKIPSFRNNTTGSINMNELKEEKKLTSQSMMFDNNYSEMDQSQLHRPSTTSTGNYSYAPSSQPPYRPPLMVRQPSVSSTSTNIGSNGGIGISPRPGSSSSSSGNNSAVPAASTPVLPMQRTNSAIRNAGGMLLTREGSSSSNYNSPSQLLASSNKIVPMSGANTPLNSHSRMYALAAALDAGDAVGKLMAEMVVSSKTKKP